MTATVDAPKWVLRACPAEGGRKRWMPEGWKACAYCAAGAARPGARSGRPSGKPVAGTFLPGLRAARRAAGVSERALRVRVGMARNTAYGYETGRCRVSWPRARAIAEALGVPVEELTDA